MKGVTFTRTMVFLITVSLAFILIKTSRYYQIENKAWAALKYELAKLIPLVQ